jgi:hypothetical protein
MLGGVDRDGNLIHFRPAPCCGEEAPVIARAGPAEGGRIYVELRRCRICEQVQTVAYNCPTWIPALERHVLQLRAEAVLRAHSDS